MLNSLEGFRVERIFVEPGEQRMLFAGYKADGDKIWEAILLETSGECCSETWFAEVLFPEAILGEKILVVQELSLPEKDDGHSRQGYDQFYGLQLHSKCGICQIVYRNSSNGYYGGSVHVVTYLPSIDVKGWKEITEDWTAYQ